MAKKNPVTKPKVATKKKSKFSVKKSVVEKKRTVTKKPAAKRTPAVKPIVKVSKQFSLTKAKAFVSTVKLPAPPRRKGLTEEKKPVPYTDGIEQSLVVGSDIVSFSKDLPTEQRSIVVNSLLLAQLASSSRVKDMEKIQAWYQCYFETLAKTGWLVQDFGFTEHKEKGADFEVHEAIISVATAVLTAGTTALTLVITALTAMQKVGNGPWMTLFKKASASSKVARFQVTTAEPSTDGGVMISLMAFELTTDNKLVQVLFFKFKTAKVTFRHASGKITLDKTRMETLAPAIEKKVSSHLISNIEEIPLI